VPKGYNKIKDICLVEYVNNIYGEQSQFGAYNLVEHIAMTYSVSIPVARFFVEQHIWELQPFYDLNRCLGAYADEDAKTNGYHTTRYPKYNDSYIGILVKKKIDK